MDQQKAQLMNVLDYYENILSKQDYLAGNVRCSNTTVSFTRLTSSHAHMTLQTYSLVDLFHLPWISFIQNRLQLSDEIESRTNTKGWWNRVSQRAATKAVFVKMSQA